MPELTDDLSPHGYMLDLFGSQAARSGGIVQRKIRDIARYVARDPFFAEMKRRGFPVVENAGQYVLFCNAEPIRRVVQSRFPRGKRNRKTCVFRLFSAVATYF